MIRWRNVLDGHDVASTPAASRLWRDWKRHEAAGGSVADFVSRFHSQQGNG